MDQELTLQNISKELRIPTELIVAFLNDKGTIVENISYEKISKEDYQLLKKEVKSLPPNTPLIYISEEDIKNFKPVTKPIEFWTEAKLSNLEKLIYRQLSYEKPKTERVVGVTPFNWSFAKAPFEGKFSTGQKFTLFDETVIELLSIKPKLTTQDLAELLGFGADTTIVSEIIKDLKLNGLISSTGIPETFELTSKGKTDQQTKTKSKPPTDAHFELFIDAFNPSNKYAKVLFDRPTKAKLGVQDIKFDYQDIEQIKILAEEQASNVHFPQAGYMLQEANVLSDKIEYFQLRFIAIITENLDSNTNNIWIFDPYKKDISRQLTQIARISESLQNHVKDSFLTEARASGELIEEVQKDVEQIEFDKAIVSSSNIDDSKSNVPEDFKPFLSYDSLNTVEFELEMEKLFDAVQHQIWLIFPWVKDGAFAQRLSLLRKVLKNKANVFIAFSENEGMVRKPGDKMVGDKAQVILDQLALNHTNFFYAELSKFHEKRVFAFLDERYKCEYSGSQNYLSFYVDKEQKGFRRENMKRVVWSPKTDEEFELRRSEFINSYLNTILKEVKKDEVLLAQSINNSKLLKTKKPYYTKAIEKIKHVNSIFTNASQKTETDKALQALNNIISKLK